jgi:hypothetical protein
MQDPLFRSGQATTKFVEDFINRSNMDSLIQSNHNLE